MSPRDTYSPPEFKHVDDMDWQMGRFANVTKFLFHPRPERPTEPMPGFSNMRRARHSRCTGTISRRSGTSSKASLPLLENWKTLRPRHRRLYAGPAF
jgi:hypothetical protein